MSNLVVLPGVARIDFCAPTEVAKVFASAADAGLKDVAIVGRDLAGKLQLWGSDPDADKTLGLLQRGVAWLATAEQVT